jgi:hypothetical protein
MGKVYKHKFNNFIMGILSQRIMANIGKFIIHSLL